MYIKSLTIQGFKSYRDQVVVNPFSERVNICVGRNGAGKSNFFSAIRFVLADAYGSLNRQERQALLHEGSSATATFSAYVEIVFDNSDGRIPTGKDEVVLRRTIGAKKDDYSLDRKSTSKAEVMSLLESAGFSRSNPFFIVPQGRITTLTNQKDHERLELLKEIAGTRVYEDRRAESTRIMEETNQKREKIDELLIVIGKRLEELEEEKKELKEFQIADRERRNVEYAIYQRDFEEARDMLLKIEQDRLNDQAASAERQQAVQAREKRIDTLESEISALEEKRDLLILTKQQDEVEKRESVKARTLVELKIRDLEETSERNAGQRQELQTSIEDLEGEISKKEAELAAVQPRFEQAQQKEADAQRLLEQAEAKQKSLFDKQARVSQYRTQKERDAFLMQQIRDSKAHLQAREKNLEDIDRNINNASSTIDQNKKKQDDVKRRHEEGKASIVEQQKQLDRLSADLAAKQEKRKEIWKEDEKLSSTIAHAKQEQSTAQKTLYGTMDGATQRALAVVRSIVDRLGLQDSVYGPLYELFETDEMFRTAVEAIAGNSLFHIVVDNDDTASKILEVLTREKKGRVTFMPLNRLRPKRVTYPGQTDEAVPMIHKLRYDPLYKPAVEQVFNQAILVQDLHIGNAYARTHQLTAITLEGDKQDRKGSLTGGYVDTKRSRLEAARQLKSWTTKFEADRERQQAIRGEKNTLDQQITDLAGKVGKAERAIKQLREHREPLLQELDALAREKEQAQDRLERLNLAKKDVESEIETTKVQLEALEEEVGTPMRNALTAEESEMLDQLATDIQKRKKEVRELNKDKQSLATKKNLLDIDLDQGMRRRLAKLRAQLDALLDPSAEGDDSSSTQANASLIARRAELDTLVRGVASLAEKIDNLENEIEKVGNDLHKKRRELDNEQTASVEDNRGLAKQQKNVERYLAKRQILLQRREESSQKIRDLGVLPEDAYTLHGQGVAVETLIKRLHKAQEKLKKFTSVNKKAVDQYSDFTAQQKTLSARREELDKSAESIEELIEVLDQRKDEAIERTFKQVSKNFADVFERLVPSGRGRLIMQKRAGGANLDDEEDDDGDEEQQEDEEMDEESEGDGIEREDESEDEEESDDEPAAKRAKKSSKSSRSKSKAASSKSKSKGKAKSKGKGKAANGKRSTGKISSYTGISIKVSFNSKSDEGQRIQQLSGGQKSIVALTLIFAIQKCDPAPFYLFDEIDANLDADRRTAVAGMIRTLSESAQFIITTFRPELLSEGDTFLGVIFDNRKISSIKKIKQAEAYEFVDTMAGGAQQQQQQQQQQRAPRAQDDESSSVNGDA